MQTQVTRPVAEIRAAKRPEFAEILDRVRKLRPEIESRALATEKAKRVPAETMEALRATDVFRTMQPARFGGFEYGPAELAQIRLRTRSRLRQYRMVRNAGGFLRLDDGLLFARSTAGGLG